MNSLTFRGIRKPYLIVTHRKRTYWAPRRLVLKQLKKGARLNRIDTDFRVEEARVEVTALEGNLRKTAEDLAGWLLSNKEEKLIFDDETDRHFLALVDGSFDAEEIVSVGYGTIRFVCLNSDKLGLEKSITVTSEFVQSTITGQTETPWTTKTTFTVPQSQFVLESDKGLKIILNYNFIAGDVLTIDADKRDIYLNGRDLATALDIRSEWNKGELKVGSVQLKATQATELKYTERYY
jgi:predicted phage tail component-like protein